MSVVNNPQNIKNKLEEAGNTAGRAATDVKHTVQNAAADVGQQAKDAASQAGQYARETAGHLGQQAKETAGHLGQQAKERANDAITGVGQGMQSLAGTIRHNVPHQGTIGSTAAVVADNLQAGGRYLQEKDLDGMTTDVANVVRRYPLQSVLIGIGAGCLLGMAFSRR